MDSYGFQNNQVNADGINVIFENDFLCNEFLKYQYFTSSLFESDWLMTKNHKKDHLKKREKRVAIHRGFFTEENPHGGGGNGSYATWYKWAHM